MREGLEAGSRIPRFALRLNDHGLYVNPFTGQLGGRSLGAHIPLENPYGLALEQELTSSYKPKLGR